MGTESSGLMDMTGTSSSKPKVTIMIPTYCQGDLVLTAVDSALAQDYENLEVIVADDASPDHTREVLATRTDPRLRYCRNQKNMGRVGNYRNTLYNLALGDWIVNLDGDDYYTDTGFISAAIAAAQADPDILMIVARRAVEVDGNVVHETQLPSEGILDGYGVLLGMPNPLYHFSHMATLYRRVDAMKTGFYERDLISSDWDSLYRLALRGKVAYLNRVVGVWRVGANSASQSGHWKSRLDNLDIWNSIFDEALLLGGDPAKLSTAKGRCQRYFAYLGFSDVLRASGLGAVRCYLDGLLNIAPGVFIRVLLDFRTVPKLMKVFCISHFIKVRQMLAGRNPERTSQ